MNDFQSPSSNGNIRVRRGKVDAVVLYEVREDELELLEKGGEATTQLNFAIFLYSLSFASLIAIICTIDYRWDSANSIFWLIFIFGSILGSYFFIIWKRSKKPIAKVVSNIRNRLSDDQNIIE